MDKIKIIKNSNQLYYYFKFYNELEKNKKIELENYLNVNYGYKQKDLKFNHNLYEKKINKLFENSKFNKYFDIPYLDIYTDPYIDFEELFTYLYENTKNKNIYYDYELTNLNYELSINFLNHNNNDYENFMIKINKENHIIIDYDLKIITNLNDNNIKSIFYKLFNYLDNDKKKYVKSYFENELIILIEDF